VHSLVKRILTFNFYLKPNTKHQVGCNFRNMVLKISLLILIKSFPSPRYEGVQRHWSSPLIINLGTRWRWLISLLCRPLYPRGRATVKHQIPNTKLGESHNRFGHFGEEITRIPDVFRNPDYPVRSLILLIATVKWKYFLRGGGGSRVGLGVLPNFLILNHALFMNISAYGKLSLKNYLIHNGITLTFNKCE
jgi:hypothetical protein